jgi:hypothetical protein
MVFSKKTELAQLFESFVCPPPGYSQTPFWWWVGEPLSLERLIWQLDQLREGGVTSAIISYNHGADGAPNLGEPKVFSEPWWALLRAVLDHARATGMTLGMQDYSLLKPTFEQIGIAHNMGGQALRFADVTSDNKGALPSDSHILEYGSDFLLSGEPITVATFTVPTAFNPLHAESGSRVIEAFYEPYRQNLGAHFGSTFAIFFQDELDFTGRFPFWSADLPNIFLEQKGYSLTGRLHELHSREPATAQFRLDFADIQTLLAEQHYFRPIFEWMERHKCLFGHDNAGRGSPGVGRSYYGDYMRTMCWYSAPGSDDPDLRGPRAFKGLKVASSIANINNRPRVWAECFHSSGWGATPAQIVNGINAAFTLGANLINLHGLYYTTNRTGWEWAPPDFHFRQPYWKAIKPLNRYIKRMSWLLSQGNHFCEVVILYPSAALAGGLNNLVTPAGSAPLSEAQRGASTTQDLAEFAAFAAGEALFASAIDFDFIDDEALANGTVTGQGIEIGGCRYRTLILPHMSAMSEPLIAAVVAFAKSGGTLIIIGPAPASLLTLPNAVILDGVDANFTDACSIGERPIFSPDNSDCRVVRRCIDEREIWFIHNSGSIRFDGTIELPSKGAPWKLDGFQGKAVQMHGQPSGESWQGDLCLAPGEAVTILFDDAQESNIPTVAGTFKSIRLPTENWDYSLSPTMDNCFEDFASTEHNVGLEIRRIEWREGEDKTWRETAPGYSPKYKILGPVPPEYDLTSWEHIAASANLDTLPDLSHIDSLLIWKDYQMSSEEGLLDDPWVSDWRSGPHGLKGENFRDWLDLPGLSDDVWYVAANLYSEDAGSDCLTVESRAAFSIWLDGERCITQSKALEPGRLPEWGLPHYNAREHSVEIPSDHQSISLFGRFEHPIGQRLRARVSSSKTKNHGGSGRIFMAQHHNAPSLPQWFQAELPPGQMDVAIHHIGKLSAWRDEELLDVKTSISATVGQKSVVTLAPLKRVSTLCLRIDPPIGIRAGDCLVSPIRAEKLSGCIQLGDWSDAALDRYSGEVIYKHEFFIENIYPDKKYDIMLGEVRCAARVWLNGFELGSVFAAPWSIPCGGRVRNGGNILEIAVSNTLANHFAEFSSTGYVYDGQLISGLFGPVELVWR